MSSSVESDEPGATQGNRWRWAIAAAFTGVIAIGVTVTVVTFSTLTEPKQETGDNAEPADDPDRLTAPCESAEGHGYDIVSPSGEYLVASPDSDPTLWHDDDSTKMINADGNDPDANTFSARAVNDSGVVVGRERDVADPTKGWRYADGEVEELSLPDGWEGVEDRGVEATGINDEGVVVGYAAGKSEGEEHTAPAKWEPGSSTPTIFDTEQDGAAKAIDGDTVVGYEIHDDERRIVKWDSDGRRQDWRGPSGKELEPFGLSGDWTVYENEGSTVRLNLSNGEEDELPSGFTIVDFESGQANLDEHGNVYGTFDTGHAGYISPDGEEHAIPMPDADEETNAENPDASDEGAAAVQYVIRGVTADGSKIVGARQETDGEGYFDEGREGDAASRVWTCEEP